MKTPTPIQLDFTSIAPSIHADQVWEYDHGSNQVCKDIPRQTAHALDRPDDFPPVASALVPGDRIAFAVDPNIPSLDEVVEGAVAAVERAEVGEINVVLWDEATETTVENLRAALGSRATVIRHQSTDRESLRYVAADEAANPVYLNRVLVDADFVLPIVAARQFDASTNHDLTGVFPTFADSASRQRHEVSLHEARVAEHMGEQPDTSWLLGLPIMVCVLVNRAGQVAEVLAGTPEALRKKIRRPRRTPDGYPPRAELVVASLDGDSEQQTWCNAARAIAAAEQYVAEGGTILLWSELREPPSAEMLKRLGLSPHEFDGDALATVAESADGFPPWDITHGAARTIARIAADHRVLIHAQLSGDEVESMEFGAVSSKDELDRLSRTVATCGVIRGAQFAGSTYDAFAKP